jgi:cilia- and flagella-associated protein 53
MMRTRMNELKLIRETDRQKVVKEKLDQQWRQNCDELRQLESKMLEKHVAKVRAGQLVEKEEQKKQEAKEKKYYDELWEQGRQKKLERERKEQILGLERKQETLRILQTHIRELREQAVKQEDLKKEEALLMVLYIHVATRKSDAIA